MKEKELQEDCIMKKLHELLPVSMDVLEKGTLIDKDLEIPFPKPVSDLDQQMLSTGPMQGPQEDASSKPVAEGERTDSCEDNEVKNIMQKDGFDVEKNPYDEVIPVPNTLVLIEVCNDLGIMYFFQENFKAAYMKFKKIFGLLEVNKGYRSSVDLITLKGFYTASASIAKLPISLPMSLQGKGDLISKAEKSLSNHFEGLIQILKEDNIAKELPIGYRLDLETVVPKSKKKDLVFKVCACNAVRECLDGRTISLNFLHSLKSASRGETSTFQELISDVLVKSNDSSDKNNLERLCRIIIPFLSKENKERFTNDSKLKRLFEKQLQLKEKRAKLDSVSGEGEMIVDLSPQLTSSLFEGATAINLDEDPAFLRRQLASTYDAEQIKQIVIQLNSINPGKKHLMGFECPMYDDLLSEMRDPVIFNTLHAFLQKSQVLVEQKEFRKALSLLSNSLDLLNQYTLKSSPGPHVGRMKNVLHHELLATEIQWQLSTQDGSMNADVIRRCKACYHHRNQDPKPKKHIYQHMVSCLLNSREMQFLVDEGGNYDGIADFRELAYHLANVAIGISRAGDAVRRDAMGLWNALLKIFTESQQQSSYERTAKSSRTIMAVISRTNLVEFAKSLKEGVILSVLASCLSAMLTLMRDDPEKELKTLHHHLWPTAFDSNVLEPKEDHVLYILHPLMDRIIDIDPQNIAWLKSRADLHFVQEQYSDAMRVYLEVGALTSAVFSEPVPYTAWDDQIYRRMIRCCQKLKAFTQVAVFCQFLDPVDYTVAFKAIQENTSEDALDSLYEYFWDTTILEFLIYAHSKRGDEDKKQLAVKTISQPELNSCNSPDTLKQSSDLRKTNFLRALSKVYWR